MPCLVIPHERRKKPDDPPPDKAVLAATNTCFQNLIADARNVDDALALAAEWVRVRRRHTEAKDDV